MIITGCARFVQPHGNRATNARCRDLLAPPGGPHAFLVIHIEDGDRSSRVVELPDGVDVTFGRSRGATVNVESEKVSRMHARGAAHRRRDRGRGSRLAATARASTATRSRARARSRAATRSRSGRSSRSSASRAACAASSAVADAVTGEARLAAEVDRSVRYHRPLTIALVRDRERRRRSMRSRARCARWT